MPSPPFLAIVLVPSPCRMLRSRWCCSARCHTLAMNAVRPFREHLVDGGVVDQGGAVARSGYWHALPLHTRIEDPQDQIEDAMIAQFAFRPARGHRQVREDKCDELRPRELHGNRRRGRAFCHLAHPDMAS